jgi:hypothetical protein
MIRTSHMSRLEINQGADYGLLRSILLCFRQSFYAECSIGFPRPGFVGADYK